MNNLIAPDLNAQAVIATERFVLRPLRASDAGLIAHYTQDRRVAEGTRSIPHPLPPGSTESYVRRAMQPEREEDVWAIDGSTNKLAELLGVVSLTRLERDQSELGFWVGAGFWNTGFATEAVAALAAANPHGSRTLFAEAFQDNPGSARVLTNCGFEYLGDAESWSVARNSRVPTWTYLRKMG
ncbi:GNAT family N-acetyltransferase [Paracoccus shanxieyensis]|uniref:GNAT family N-acetyltransferase n=1 Tax=Paracoccus shanxieyensis TaxID=2675752 RepID=A0A6L6ITF6_9RHOB|nr:GNAT family N-acetyltransferase [Paracoccus shanxieyensis]MTH63453.1 GNAT family N-acetyltransferase [Paracoccus shanxieyensis]MTH86374.1 GNAT family N-acetyltransferase [Paracoccus shanxieyensis]